MRGKNTGTRNSTGYTSLCVKTRTRKAIDLVVEDNLKQRIVYADSIAVLNVPKFPEAIEEKADPRPCAPNHLG
jgi:hypothetical protein